MFCKTPISKFEQIKILHNKCLTWKGNQQFLNHILHFSFQIFLVFFHSHLLHFHFESVVIESVHTSRITRQCIQWERCDQKGRSFAAASSGNMHRKYISDSSKCNIRQISKWNISKTAVIFEK